jgi:hypothetical protein
MRTSSDSRLVYFEVKASGGYAIITLQAGDENISKPTTVTVPWSKNGPHQKRNGGLFNRLEPVPDGRIKLPHHTGQKQPGNWKKISAPKNGVACAGIVP